MPTSSAESGDRRDSKPRSDTLSLLYQGVFTGIVRLQAGRQRLTDPVTFRRRIKDALQDTQKEAGTAGYNAREIRDAEAAVVAFLDEVVLSLDHPARDQWVIKPLSVDLYGDANAGEVFFDRLEELRGQTDSTHLADLLEVYLLCLLLGFEGKYSGAGTSEGHLIADRLRIRIERIRGGSYRLSPPLRFAQGPIADVKAPPQSALWRWWPLPAMAAPLALFFLYRLNLHFKLSDLLSSLR